MNIKPMKIAASAVCVIIIFSVCLSVFHNSERVLPPNPIVRAEAVTELSGGDDRAVNQVPKEESTTQADDIDKPVKNRRTAQKSQGTYSERVREYNGSSSGTIPYSGENSGNYSKVYARRGEPASFNEITTNISETTAALSTETTAVLREETTIAESTTEINTEATTAKEDDTVPAIVTDLKDCIIEETDISDGKLGFYAYLSGNNGSYSLKVHYLHADDKGSGKYLSPKGIDFSANIKRGSNYFTLYVKKGNVTVSYVRFTVEVTAKVADEEHSQVGEQPPVISTNLDGMNEKIRQNRFTLIVTAKTFDGKTIYSDGISVTLDGKEIHDPLGSGTYEYSLFFENPASGEEERHRVTVLAWDKEGKSSFKSYTVTYRHVAEGSVNGEVTVVLDATTVGLGILDEATVSVKQGENAAEVLIKMLDEYGYTYEMAGSASSGFYLRSLGRPDLCADAKVPENLWKMILRDGIVTHPDKRSRDSLKEYDYTMGSGWMYCINNTLYPGGGMDKCYLNDGDIFTVIFTLSFGKDIGGYSGNSSSSGSLKGYCGLWKGGSYIPLEHSWVPDGTDSSGNTKYVCSVCHEEK